MRILTIISYFIFLLIVTFGCINNQKKTAVVDKMESSEMITAQVIGVYRGNLPCADCEAIRTVLLLDSDYSYKLTYIYEGKSIDTFVKVGDWSVDKNYLKLNGEDYKYKIENDYLVQLDLSGKEITGDIAERYLLSKVK